MKISDINLVADSSGGADNRQLLPSIGRSSRISALASIRWQSAYATHIDSRFFDMLNVWRDFFPAETEAQLGGLTEVLLFSHCAEVFQLLEGGSYVHRKYRSLIKK